MQHPQPPSRWLIIAAFAAIYIIWGSSYIVIHFAVETIPPFLMMGGRFLAAGVALFLISQRSGAKLPTRANWQAAAFTGFFMFVLNAGAIAYSEANLEMPSGVVAVLLATMPIWMVLINWLSPGGSPPTPMIIAGIAVGFVGIILLSIPEAGMAALSPVGVVIVLAAAGFWAFGSIRSRTAALPDSAPLSTGMQLMCGGIGLLLVSVLSGELIGFAPSQVSTTSLLAMIYLGVFNSFVGFSAFVWLMRVSNPAHVATYAYVNPVIAVILGALLASEPLTPRSVIAGVIILLSVFLITAQRVPFVHRFRVTKSADVTVIPAPIE